MVPSLTALPSATHPTPPNYATIVARCRSRGSGNLLGNLRLPAAAGGPSLGALLTGVQHRTDAVILGRVGYDDWAAYWPNAETDQDFGKFITNVPKYVASRTRTGKLEWKNSTLIKGELETFVRDLKGREGWEIAVMSSVSLVRQLLFAGLLDELTLITHPVIAGKGRHLFEPTDPTTRLRLIDCIRTAKGNVVTTYAKT